MGMFTKIKEDGIVEINHEGNKVELPFSLVCAAADLIRDQYNPTRLTFCGKNNEWPDVPAPAGPIEPGAK